MEKGGGINKAKELKEEMGITPQTLSYHLKELEDKRLVRAMPDKNNKRQKRYEITNAGRLVATWSEVI